MPSRFRLVLSLVATRHDAVTKCWGTFVKNSLLRSKKGHQYNSNEGRLKGSEGSEKFSKFPFLHSSKIENVLIILQKWIKNHRFGGLKRGFDNLHVFIALNQFAINQYLSHTYRLSKYTLHCVFVQVPRTVRYRPKQYLKYTTHHLYVAQ